MNRQIRDLLIKAEGRYFEPHEEADLESYADGLLARIDSVQAVERAESLILDDVVAAVTKAHDALSRDYGTAAPQLVRRDQMMVLRYATTSMLMHDKNLIHDKLAVWLRTIMYALCKPDQVLFGYRALVDACRRHLGPDDAEALVPFVEVVIQEFESAQGGMQAS